MTRKGMTPEAVEALAQQIDTAAQDARTAYDGARSRLEELEWTGQDSESFRVRVEDDLGSAMQRLATSAEELSARARRDAAEQREASAA